jgi:hypothetical protein
MIDVPFLTEAQIEAKADALLAAFIETVSQF